MTSFRSVLALGRDCPALLRWLFIVMFTVLAVWLSGRIITGLHTGFIRQPGRWLEPHIVNRYAEPGWFWASVVIESAICVWLYYGVFTEILDTLRGSKHR
jgi:hypothetical protein